MLINRLCIWPFDLSLMAFAAVKSRFFDAAIQSVSVRETPHFIESNIGISGTGWV